MGRKTKSTVWESLKKKVEPFNGNADRVKEFEEFSKFPVICITYFENTYLHVGSPSMRAGFACDPLVTNKFFSAMAHEKLPFEDNANDDEVLDAEVDINGALEKHVFDMNVMMMRAIITAVVSPKNAVTNKDKRKNLYTDVNMPVWWQETGLPFRSVNHNSDFKQTDLWLLIEALQHSKGIIPNPPSRRPKTTIFSSRFYHNSDDTINTSMATPSHDNNVNNSECTSTQGDADTENDGEGSSSLTQDDTGTNGTASVSSGTLCQEENCIPLISDCQSVNLVNSAADRRAFIGNATLEQLHSHAVDYAKVLLKSDSWAEMTILSNSLLTLVNTVNEIPSSTSVLENEDVGNQSYLQSIPLDANDYSFLKSSADGNCMFHAISIIMHGNEAYSKFYRLITVVNVVDRLQEVCKYILKEYQQCWQLWVSMVSDDPIDSFDLSNPSEVIETVCRKEIQETLKSFHRDCCSRLDEDVLGAYLMRPVHQHCGKVGSEYDIFRKCIPPPLDQTDLPPIHLVWVPSNPNSTRLSHIIPAVCRVGVYDVPLDHCPLLKIGRCTFQEAANLGKGADMVECMLCHQHVHCKCAQTELSDSYICGCDKFSTNFKLNSPEIYSTTMAVEKLNKIDIHASVKYIIETPSLRKFLFMERPHYSKGLMSSLRKKMGPFTDDDVVHNIMVVLKESVPGGLRQFVPDVFLPEVLLHLIQNEEHISRMLSEFVLYGYYEKRK